MVSAQGSQEYADLQISVFSVQPPLDMVVDIGCGSGQSTSVFAAHFTKALGVDPSEGQIKFAIEKNKCANVEFQVISIS